eukprot:NODE_23487_length_664_cov_2.638734.p2 GENE.NODE_23487_length_664_cov_2.638734~~NODE_23487_length_664_cov_2.638734.p2  ORF type:complete len:120 (-),score=24.68 NODE_23487_length_664_cov_2.638734:121-480(-)
MSATTACEEPALDLSLWLQQRGRLLQGDATAPVAMAAAADFGGVGGIGVVGGHSSAGGGAGGGDVGCCFCWCWARQHGGPDVRGVAALQVLLSALRQRHHGNCSPLPVAATCGLAFKRA